MLLPTLPRAKNVFIGCHSILVPVAEDNFFHKCRDTPFLFAKGGAQSRPWAESIKFRITKFQIYFTLKVKNLTSL